MGLLQEFRDFTASMISWPADLLIGFGLPPSQSGAIVNEFSSIQVATYFACIRVISDAVGALPLNVYERKADGSEVVAYNHPLFDPLHTQPNSDTIAADFRQTIQSHALIAGNGYAEIVRNNAGQAVDFYVRSPFSTTTERRSSDGTMLYKTHDQPGGPERLIEAGNMIHLRGWGIDSIVGLSPVKYQLRELLGIEIAAQVFGANMFKNSGTPTGILTAPTNLKKDQRLQALNSWMQAQSKGNQHMPAILENGWKFEPLSWNPENLQLLQLRELNRSQIAAMMGVPEHMIGGQEDTKATAEQKALEFKSFTLKPWLNKWEQSLNCKLFPTLGRNAGKFFVKFDTTELERADYKTMLQGLQMARYAGLITANEARKQLGLNPYEEKQLTSTNPGDRLLQPVNMVFVGENTLDDQQSQQGTDSENEGESPVSSPHVNPPAGEKNAADKEITHYFLRYSSLFTDAFHRVQARKKPDAKDFERTFSPVLTSIAAAFSFNPDAEPGEQIELSAELAQFVRDYTAGMAQRASTWKSDTETISGELKRAIAEIRSKAVPTQE